VVSFKPQRPATFAFFSEGYDAADRHRGSEARSARRSCEQSVGAFAFGATRAPATELLLRTSVLTFKPLRPATFAFLSAAVVVVPRSSDTVTATSVHRRGGEQVEERTPVAEARASTEGVRTRSAA
jgi:hypothetical protein